MKKSRVSKLTEYWIEPSWSVKLLAVLSVFCMVFYLASCKKDKENPLEPGYTKPLYLGGGGTQATGMDLSYDVAIQKTVSFQNGLTSASPAWKKLQAVPQTESYSLQVNIGNGNFYLLQDNIEVRSEIRDRVPVEEKIAKIEITGGVYTAYNASGHVISSKSIGNLSQGFLEGVDVQFNNAPIDTDTLAAHGIQYSVNGNSVTIVNSIANGDTANNVSTFNINNGRPLLIMSFDDNDPSKLTSMISHEYNDAGNLLSSVITYYDYLEDGDVRTKVERWSYSNFALNLY